MRREINPTSARIYHAVKRQLLGGAFRPGEHLDAAQLAENLAASITPVRAALHRLAGEQLVDTRAGAGFHAPAMTEVSLRDLYAWNGYVLQLSVQISPQGPREPVMSADLAAAPGAQGPDDLTATDRLFRALGALSGNEQCAAAIDGLNDRLHFARLLEARVFADLDQELANFADVLASQRPADIRHAIALYHRRRIRTAADIVQLMHRLKAGV
jgi:DNA-binding GntR family transcriptional regulator